MSDKVCTHIKVYKRSHNNKVLYILLMNLDPATYIPCMHWAGMRGY